MTSPPLARTMPDGTRRYVHPVTAESEPSVTSIMKMLNKPALEGWSARTTAEYADTHWDELAGMDSDVRVREMKAAYKNVASKAADLGTAIHEICEKFAAGNPSGAIPKQADPYISQFTGFLADHRPQFLENEVTVWSRTYGYAGTADAVALIDGEVTWIDWKTGKGVYPEYGMQLAALSHADFIIRPDGSEEEMYPAFRHAIVHLRPRSWKYIQLREVEACFAAFLACKKLHAWQDDVAPQVLGDAR